MGNVSGVYGVQGWVRVISHTQPRVSITRYQPLYLHIRGQWQPLELEDGRLQGKGVLIKFAGYDDRDSVLSLIGCDIAVRRDQLPALEADEYYWTDLQGLRVITVDGVELGRVARLFETGANDVLVVAGERERLIPFLQNAVIKMIDLQQGLIQVDWDPNF